MIQFSSGQLVTANQMNLLAPLFVSKSSNQSVTNSATLVNDNDIVFTLVANQTAHLQLRLGATNTVGTTAGIKLAWALTGTVSLVGRHGVGPAGASSTPATNATMHAYQFNSTSPVNYGVDLNTNGTVSIWEELFLTGGASGGTVQLQWAQNTAGVSTTTVLAGSFCTARYVA